MLFPSYTSRDGFATLGRRLSVFVLVCTLLVILSILGAGKVAWAQDATGTLGDTTDTLGGSVPATETVTPVQDTVAPVQDTVAPVQDTVQDTVTPVQDTVAPVQDTVQDTVAPVQDTVTPVQDTVQDTVAPVQDTVAPVQDTVAPVQDTVTPVQDTVQDTVAPVQDTVTPVQDTVTPVQDTVEPQPTGAAVGPLTGPAKQTTEPVVGSSSLDPVLRAGSSPAVAPLLEEGAALAPSAASANSSSAPLAATVEGISLGASTPGPAPVGSVRVGDLEGPSSSRAPMGGQRVPLTAPPSGRPAVPLFSMAEHSLISDFATTTVARNASSQLPQSLPFSGALPAPASGSASGGSSLGGAGPHPGGALAHQRLIALLSGKFLWYARNFLKPDSAHGLIINQPG